MEKTRIKNKGVRARLAAGAWLFAAVLLLGGCSKEPAEGMDGPSGQVALDFSIEGIEKMLPVTRAALATGTTVRVIAYKAVTRTLQRKTTRTNAPTTGTVQSSYRAW